MISAPVYGSPVMVLGDGHGRLPRCTVRSRESRGSAAAADTADDQR